jgi:hypothetical protein
VSLFPVPWPPAAITRLEAGVEAPKSTTQSEEILAFPPCFGHCSDIDSAIGQVDDSAIGQFDLANKSPAHFCSAVRW